MAAQRTTDDDLGWIANVLVTGLEGARVDRAAPPGHEALFTFAAVPSARRPYALLPTEASVAAAAIEGLGNPVTWPLRLAERAVTQGYRSGLLQRLLPDRVVVSAPETPTVPMPTIRDHFERLLARSDLRLAVILGTRRPNRKPVIKIMTSSGEVLGFAKIGWNDVSRALVRNEAAVLRRLAELPPPRSFEVPRVIDHLAVGDLDLLVLGRIGPRGGARVMRFPTAVGREISETVQRSTEVLATSAYWSGIRARVERLVAGDGRLGPTLASALDVIEHASGAREVVFGAWHGDFTPWNMRRGAGTVAVWDWERSGSIVPVGMDAARFDLDVRLKIDRERPRDAIHNSAMAIGATLERMGAVPGTASLVTVLHVLEMVLRFEEATIAGVPGREPLYEAALDEAAGRVSRRAA
jgi:hypothetical protein